MEPEPPERALLRIFRHPLVLVTALAGGVLIGLLAPRIGIALEPVGRIYLFLLQMTVLPIVVLATASGLGTIVQQPGTLRLAVRSLLVVLLFLLATGAVGLAVALVVRPGSGMGAAGQAILSSLIRRSPQGADTVISGSGASRDQGSALDIVTGIVPRNIFASLSAGTILQVLLFSLILGLAIGLLRDKQRDYLLEIAQSALAAFKKINRWLIYLLPIGAACLAASAIVASETSLFPAIADLLITLGATMAGAALLLFLLLWWRSGRRIGETASALVEPLTYAFITGSSFVGLPYSLRALEERLGFHPERVRATLPTVVAVLRCGTMLTFILAASFVASLYGVSWSAAECGTLLLFAAAASFASAAGGGAAALAGVSLVFGALGLPAEPVVVIFAAASLVIYPVLAAFETHVALAAASLLSRAPAAVAARAPRRRLVSIRATILTLLATLILLTGGVTIGLMYSGQRRNISYLADAVIRDVSARVVQRTTNYLSPAERSSESLRYLLETGLLDVRDRDGLRAAMRNALRNNPEFAAVYFGDTAGNFTMVKRMPDGSVSERLIERSEVSVTIDWRHENLAYEAGFPDSVESLTQGYDPRSRGWYRSAVSAKGRIWTDVYLFASDNMLGVSSAVPIYGSAASLRGVVAVDIGLAELSYFLGSLDLSSAGKAFILNEKDQLVALSVPRGSDLSALFAGKPTGSAASTANLVPADAASDALVQQSFLAWLHAQRSPASLSFRAGRERYLSAVTDFGPDAAFPWKIGIVIPESEIFGFVNTTSRIVLGAALLIILASIG